MELAKKLKLKASKQLVTIGAGDVTSLLPGVVVVDWQRADLPISQALVFVSNAAALGQFVSIYSNHILPETLLWIAYPKQSSGIESDLIKMEPWQVLRDAGFRGQASVAIDDIWSAVRFTNAPLPQSAKTTVPMQERKTEGIDYKNRITTLPADVASALNQIAGLTEFFESMSFSHKRAYLEAIADAKKPETRQRRIEKTLEMVMELAVKKRR